MHRLRRGYQSDERYGRMTCMMDEEGRRGPDYVQERTGHTLRSFSHGMTLNSNTEYLVEPVEYEAKNSKFLDEVQLVDFGECMYPCIDV